MHHLNFPEYKFKMIQKSQKRFIFDKIRKRYVVLTPEELVRQNMIQYLISEKQYPLALIAVEMPLKVNNTQKRSDVVVYGRDGKPKLIVELKAPNITISQKTFDQIARYNMPLKVNYLIVSNGKQHYCCLYNHKLINYQYLKQIPDFSQISSNEK
jgi:predicted type IV restriction endonuclease